MATQTKEIPLGEIRKEEMALEEAMRAAIIELFQRLICIITTLHFSAFLPAGFCRGRRALRKTRFREVYL